ncbi:MAG: hypothetical protein GY856_05970 [bacterium]|nr:hypothetical protein [bacterium]
MYLHFGEVVEPRLFGDPKGSGAPGPAPEVTEEPPTAAIGEPAAEPAAPTAVDPRALAQAVAAVAPTLPKDHRRSLATVFRVLADVLEAEDDRA